jgi:hypothetical protein
MSPRQQHRIEITLTDERLAALDEARGHEPRASFIKRWVDKGIAHGNVEIPPADISEATRREGAAALTRVPTADELEEAMTSMGTELHSIAQRTHKANCKCPICTSARPKGKAKR